MSDRLPKPRPNQWVADRLVLFKKLYAAAKANK